MTRDDALRALVAEVKRTCAGLEKLAEAVTRAAKAGAQFAELLEPPEKKS